MATQGNGRGRVSPNAIAQWESAGELYWTVEEAIKDAERESAEHGRAADAYFFEYLLIDR